MDPINEAKRAGDVVVFELDKNFSRDAVTIASGEGALPAGAVLGRVTASGEFVLSPNASVIGKEGAETAAAVLVTPVDATSAAAEAVAITNVAIVNRSNLTFEASVANAAQRQAKVDQLAAVNIKARQGA